MDKIGSGWSSTDPTGYRRYIDECPDAVILTDRDGRIEHVNPAFQEMTGYCRAELIGRTPAVLKSGEHEADFYRGLWATISAGNDFQATFVNRKKSGDVYHEEKIIRPLFDSDGRITHYASFGRDATRFSRALKKLAHAATHDSLTDLPNRRLFLDRLAQAMRQSARSRDAVTVAILDLDRFKDTNTGFGHLAGDAVLQAVASRTRSCLRNVDTVARIGGDEFGLILPGTAGESTLKALEKVVSANAGGVPYENQVLRSSVSIGACCYPRDAATAQDLLKRADAAMYAAKHSGGNRCCFDSPGSAAVRHEGTGEPA